MFFSPYLANVISGLSLRFFSVVNVPPQVNISVLQVYTFKEFFLTQLGHKFYLGVKPQSQRSERQDIELCKKSVPSHSNLVYYNGRRGSTNPPLFYRNVLLYMNDDHLINDSLTFSTLSDRLQKTVINQKLDTPIKGNILFNIR